MEANLTFEDLDEEEKREVFGAIVECFQEIIEESDETDMWAQRIQSSNADFMKEVLEEISLTRFQRADDGNLVFI